MLVKSAANSLPPSPFPGLTHRTLARRGDGLGTLSVWNQAITPGNATPLHRHDCDEVVVILAGSGTVLVDGQAWPFQTGDTLILPAGCDHQIVSSGVEDLRVVATFGASPVVTAQPDGQVMELPWAS